MPLPRRFPATLWRGWWGGGAPVDLLIEDLAIDLEGRPYAVAQAGAGWMLRTRPAYAPAIRAAADVGGRP